MPYGKLITRFTTGGHNIFITCPAKSMHLEPFGLSVHAFCGTGDENIIPTCRSAGNYYLMIQLHYCVTRAAEYIIEIYKVLIFPLIVLTHRVIASRLCERTLRQHFANSARQYWAVVTHALQYRATHL